MDGSNSILFFLLQDKKKNLSHNIRLHTYNVNIKDNILENFKNISLTLFLSNIEGIKFSFYFNYQLFHQLLKFNPIF